MMIAAMTMIVGGSGGGPDLAIVRTITVGRLKEEGKCNMSQLSPFLHDAIPLSRIVRNNNFLSLSISLSLSLTLSLSAAYNIFSFSFFSYV